MTEQMQKATYKQIKENFGDFQSLNYVETWIQSSNTDMKIYRFKGDFDKSKEKLEKKQGKLLDFGLNHG